MSVRQTLPILALVVPLYCPEVLVFCSPVKCATGGTGSKPDGQGGSVQVDPVQVGRVDVVQVDLVQVDQWIYSMLFTLVNSRWKR